LMQAYRTIGPKWGGRQEFILREGGITQGNKGITREAGFLVSANSEGRGGTSIQPAT